MDVRECELARRGTQRDINRSSKLSIFLKFLARIQYVLQTIITSFLSKDISWGFYINVSRLLVDIEEKNEHYSNNY